MTEEFTEIERKYLVHANFPKPDNFVDVEQGYLSEPGEPELRVRIETHRALLTMKTRHDYLSANALTSEISPILARALLKLCDPEKVIVKRRFFVTNKHVTWEVDEFYGSNTGLIIAEVELDTVSQNIALPDWIGREITFDAKYTNSSLFHYPFNIWGT